MLIHILLETITILIKKMFNTQIGNPYTTVEHQPQITHTVNHISTTIDTSGRATNRRENNRKSGLSINFTAITMDPHRKANKAQADLSAAEKRKFQSSTNANRNVTDALEPRRRSSFGLNFHDVHAFHKSYAFI